MAERRPRGTAHLPPVRTGFARHIDVLTPLLGRWRAALVGAAVAPVLAVHVTKAPALDLVRNGRPVAVVVTSDGTPGRGIGARGWETDPDAEAAKVLIDWIEKITDVRLDLADTPREGSPVVFVGRAAVDHGLRLDDIDSPSHEGLRVVVQGETALVGGQDGQSTIRAACRFLESLGCRYFMDASRHPIDQRIGEVYPRARELAVVDFVHAESPGMAYRDIWGSSFYFPSLWRLWNGNGGVPMATGHSWAAYVPKADYGQDHPEYFTLRDGRRNVDAEWLCTSNRRVRDIFVRRLLEQAKANPKGSFSISPPDNRQYCQCEACRAQDDPEHREISSGSVSMTSRFLDFYDDIAGRVYEQYPDVALNFYCYADYTEPPRRKVKASPNLVAWIAPIRYSRYHAIGSPLSPSKRFEQTVIEGWSDVVGRLGYRAYNANLAECTVPFSKMLTWKHDLPYLKQRGCVGVNNETFVAWGLMCPHIYQSIRLMYDPGLDSDTLMDDYFTRFYGQKAGIPMKEYWTTIDRCFQDLASESGCFYALHLVYTPATLRRLRSLLDTAVSAAGNDEILGARIALACKGLEMARDCMAFRDRLNDGQPAKAKEIADRMHQRAKDDQFAFHNKTLEYVRRFLVRLADPATALTTPPNRLLQVLPDEWLMTMDPDQKGVGAGFHLPDADTAGWTPVKTFSATLSEQGVTGQSTFLWYRCSFTAPHDFERLMLLFCDLDGAAETSRLFVNGKEIRSPGTECSFEPNRLNKGVASWRRREPLWTFVEKAVEPGRRNTVTLLIDNRSISENALGGIVRPVYLIETPVEAGTENVERRRGGQESELK